MEKSSLRVLVVDDFLPMRRVICSQLRTVPELQLIMEASNGVEAVQIAKDWQPDIIVMDIGLPRLNGVEAARQVLQLSPNSRIVFLSHETSREFIEEALAIGAKGYVPKSQVGRSLVSAVRAIIRNETAFIA